MLITVLCSPKQNPLQTGISLTNHSCWESVEKLGKCGEIEKWVCSTFGTIDQAGHLKRMS